MAKKHIALILAILVLMTAFTSCAGGKTPNAEETTTNPKSKETLEIPNDDTTFKLSYTKSDSLNPFDSVTQNNQVVAQLVFESLFDLDESYKSSLNIASSYVYTDKATLEIMIASGLKFSDGSDLTAHDVKYSFEKAKSSVYWGNSLAGITGCSVKSDTELAFTLDAPNNYAHNLLVFPIMSTEEKDGYPVGSGRYYFASEDGEVVLKANTAGGFNPHLTTIHLENITSSDSIDNAVNIGNISFAYRDLSEGSGKKISANKKLVNMNNLVYIGVNNKSGITSNAYIRKAISLAIDRETLVKSAYGNFGAPAGSVFNPQFELSSTQLFEKNADINAAKQALSQSGEGSRTLSLLVNGDNGDRVTCAKLIKQELDAAGFNVNLDVTNGYDEYADRIYNERFDLYLGETKITPDMSLRTFFGGATGYGIDATASASAASYGAYLNGEAELGAFLLDFSNEMPYIPLLYRKGMICFTKAMNGDMQGTHGDCFGNIENWYFKS